MKKAKIWIIPAILLVFAIHIGNAESQHNSGQEWLIPVNCRSAEVSIRSISSADEHLSELMNDFFRGLRFTASSSADSLTGSIAWGNTEINVSNEDISIIPTFPAIVGFADFSNDVASLFTQWYDLFEEYPENRQEIRDAVSIKNVAVSSRVIRYTFTADDFNALWPQLIGFSDRYPSLSFVLHALSEQTGLDFRSAIFASPIRISHLFDNNEEEFGTTFSVSASFGQDVYRLALTCGHLHEKGCLYSIEITKARGNNQYSFSIGWKKSQKNTSELIDLSGLLRIKTNARTINHTLQGSLKNTISETHTLTGKITVSSNVNGLKFSTDLTLDLISDTHSADGVCTLSHYLAGEEGWSIVCDCSFSDAEEPIGSQNNSNAPESFADLIAQEAIKRLSKLSEDDRILLIHYLQTSQWMNMEPYSQQQGNTENDSEWSVEEE